MHDLLAPPSRCNWVSVHRDVMDIATRVVQGDELWRGDPDLELVQNARTGKFEVIGFDAHGELYVALVADRCDTEILTRLAASDWQRNKNAATESLAANRRRREQIDAEARDARAERLACMAFELRKVVGHHYGGMSRTTWGFSATNAKGA